MPSDAYPAAERVVADTPIEQVEAALARLHAHREAWQTRSLARRVEDLDTLIVRLEAEAPAMVAAADSAKRLGPEHPCHGEDWQTLAWATMRNLVGLRRRLRALAAGEPSPVGSSAPRLRPNGQVVVPALPETFWDRLLLMGYTGEVWLRPGVTLEAARSSTGQLVREPPPVRVGLVLGAGNVGSIPMMDAIYKLFVENELVVLKMNPVNAYLGPHIEAVFAHLVAEGFFAVVQGGAEVGKLLCEHPLVDTLHITGSDATYDAIVWGPPEGRAERKASGQRVNERPITAELGNVTPIVIVPGAWSARELEYQAWNVAGMVTNNASFNCVAGKVLVVAEGWPQRAAFLARLREVLASIPPRHAYYPGARDRWRSFREAHPQAEILSPEVEASVPWTLIPGLDPQVSDDPCFRREPFCAILSEVALPGETAVDFLPVAVDFCNERLWGTLAAAVIIHPRCRRDPANEAAFQEALDELRYGSIAVNQWPGVNYGLSTLTWGAFPGHTAADIQSGEGVVHNSYLLASTQKSVLYAPFTQFPRPVWLPNHRKAAEVGRRMTQFEHKPGLLAFLGVLWAAITG